MQRREVLKTLLAGAGLWLTPGVTAWAAPRATGYARLLILIELKGGNDGLNTLIPYADPQYRALRPKLAIARDQVVLLDEQLGLHPALAPLLPLWQTGRLALVQGLGYPEPNLSHFRSIEIWDTASKSNEYLTEGWLTRVFAARPAPPQFAADGVIVGSSDLGPLAGGARAIALKDTGQFLNRARFVDNHTAAPGNAALAHLLKVEGDIRQAAQGLRSERALRTEFPKHAFGQTVRTAAQVLAAEQGVAVLRLTHNGFDTHSNQLVTHARLLTELAEGLVALQAALSELGRWDQTLVLSYAEFGRRARENGSGGTDHGTAAPHVVLGGQVRGGLYGARPELARLDDGNLRHALDFRSLYATVIDRWWGLDARAVLGARFEVIPGLLA